MEHLEASVPMILLLDPSALDHLLVSRQDAYEMAESYRERGGFRDFSHEFSVGYLRDDRTRTCENICQKLLDRYKIGASMSKV